MTRALFSVLLLTILWFGCAPRQKKHELETVNYLPVMGVYQGYQKNAGGETRRLELHLLTNRAFYESSYLVKNPENSNVYTGRYTYSNQLLELTYDIGSQVEYRHTNDRLLINYRYQVDDLLKGFYLQKMTNQ